MGFLKGFSKEEKSWMMYDWANSAESVIIVTILPIFYDTISANSTAAINRWGYGTSLAMLVCALLAPLLGALGDFKGMRKKLFFGKRAASIESRDKFRVFGNTRNFRQQSQKSKLSVF